MSADVLRRVAGQLADQQAHGSIRGAATDVLPHAAEGWDDPWMVGRHVGEQARS